MNTNTNRAFTLIELLVVITIIVVLLALLVPTMDKAVRTAEATACLAMNRVWTTGMQFYAQDNGRRRLYIDYGQVQDPPDQPYITWFHLLGKYVGSPSFTGMSPNDADAASRPILKANKCPSTVEDSATGGFGSASGMWNISRTQGAYGVNNWVVEMKQSNYDEPGAGFEFTGKYTAIPGDVPFIADCNYVDSYPKPNEDVPMADTESGDTSTRGIGRNLINRHGGSMTQQKAINVGYVDGSVANVELWRVWTLRWNRNGTAVRDYEDYVPYQ